ncbi:organic solute transporter subunit alpha-like isoform X1 [Styela clava]
MSNNCSNNVSPNITTFFAHISTAEAVAVCFEGLTTLLLIFIFLNDCFHFKRESSTSSRLQSILIIQLSYVAYSTSSFLAIISPRSSTLAELAFIVYFSFTLKELMSLMLHYLGGADYAVGHLGGLQARISVTPFACMCSYCCPKVYFNKKFVMFIKIGVYQSAILHPIFDFISAFLWTNGLYLDSDLSLTSPSLYFVIVEKVSILIAMYAITSLYWTARKELDPHHINGKFLTVQALMVISGFQEFAFNILTKFGLIQCKGILNAADRAAVLHHFAVVPEMLILYVISCYFHRQPLGEEFEIPSQRSTSLLTTNHASYDSTSDGETDPLLDPPVCNGNYNVQVQPRETNQLKIQSI